MSKGDAPRPRKADGLEVNEVADGYVIYDKDKEQVHYLNHTAALILEYCNGEHTPDRIAELLQLAYDLGDPPLEEVTECLSNLRSQGLIG